MTQRRTQGRRINREAPADERDPALLLVREMKAGAAAGPSQERDTMRVRVYRALARGLMAGMFKPGEAVTLRTLAHGLGTSAMPVREAVSRLIAERALVLLPNRSVIVPRMSRARFIELTQVRRILEGHVTESACARTTPALLRELSEINDAMKRCVAVNDFHGALSRNMAFHFTLYRAAGKPVALALIEMLWLQAGPFLALSLTTPGIRWTARHHQAVLAGLRASLANVARRAVEADIEDTGVQLLKKAIFEDANDAAALENHPMLLSPQ
jgi:DNA-binding GntR family transcriptional regulator